MLPIRLNALKDLAYNLWWSWDTDATALWQEVDPWRWDRCRQNPVALLEDVEQARWEELAGDALFCNRLDAIEARFRGYLENPGWAAEHAPTLADKRIAYLSMEYGLHSSLRIYSGGLGVLAGDHLRSASDLGVPLVALGLLYRNGYFRQLVDDGQQIDAYPLADFNRLPLKLCTDEEGRPIQVQVDIGPVIIRALIHRLDVGRVRLYLLDTDHDQNDSEGRALTSHLYGGDQYTRIRQEALLGIGGLRALTALGENADVFHLNEGHCAFAVLELMRERVVAGAPTWSAALADVRTKVVFTTHTPVPAGHDRFHWELVNGVLGTWRDALGLPEGTFMDLGRVRPGDWSEPLCMTVLALRGAAAANGVSALHGAVSRGMWQALYPGRQVEDVPIGHVTNGVHPIFWMSSEARDLYDEYAEDWRSHLFEPEFWEEAVARIPDEALWNLRFKLRKRLVNLVEDRTGSRLDPQVLTIGFARRFAPYKRGNLLFRDPERARALLNGPTPIQVVFAGKAHPRDTNGQDIVKRVVRWSNRVEFRNRVAFVEDYDMALGAALTSGADIWLNNPRRPKEASGTSGQKAPLNGGINLSVLDGWWPEAHDGTNGWQIGDGRQWTDDVEAHDAFDANSLYQRLEEDILPLWQERDAAGIPRAWLQVVRRSIATCLPRFNSHRMVRDYVTDFYVPLLND